MRRCLLLAAILTFIRHISLVNHFLYFQFHILLREQDTFSTFFNLLLFYWSLNLIFVLKIPAAIRS
jgi:hypothetical protein